MYFVYNTKHKGGDTEMKKQIKKLCVGDMTKEQIIVESLKQIGLLIMAGALIKLIMVL